MSEFNSDTSPLFGLSLVAIAEPEASFGPEIPHLRVLFDKILRGDGFVVVYATDGVGNETCN